MYREIGTKYSLIDIFKSELIQKGFVTEQQIAEMTEKYNKILQESFDKSKTFIPKLEDIKNENYKGQKALTKKWKSNNK